MVSCRGGRRSPAPRSFGRSATPTSRTRTRLHGTCGSSPSRQALTRTPTPPGVPASPDRRPKRGATSQHTGTDRAPTAPVSNLCRSGALRPCAVNPALRRVDSTRVVAHRERPAQGHSCKSERDGTMHRRLLKISVAATGIALGSAVFGAGSAAADPREGQCPGGFTLATVKDVQKLVDPGFEGAVKSADVNRNKLVCYREIAGPPRVLFGDDSAGFE